MKARSFGTGSPGSAEMGGLFARLLGIQGLSKGRATKKSYRPKKPSHKLTLETLEERTLLATTPTVPPIVPPASVLSVQKLSTLAINGKSLDSQQSKSGSGMAGGDVNVKVAADGTLNAAVDTGYLAIDPSLPQVALLVRRPSGTWDPLYKVDTVGLHPIVLLNETLGILDVAYTVPNSTAATGIKVVGENAYSESPTSAIAFAPKKTLFAGLHDDVTSTKQNWTDSVMVFASSRTNPPPSTDPTIPTPPATGEVVSAFLTTASKPVATNKAPVVNAGADQTVSISQSAKLPGNVKDDGLPKLPGKVTTIWSKVSGPGTVAFASASSANTTVSFGTVGTYVVRLQASDGDLTASDDVQITVTPPPPNQVPVVNAGPDQSLQGSSATVLQGTVRDDGQPNPPGNLTTNWWQVSGPGTVTFASGSSTKTNATFSSPGVYVLRLEANDGALTASDDVQITVAAAPPNQAPVVNAGPDQNLLGATTTVLQGSARDDGLPKPPGKVTTKWTQVSGPGTVTFAHASSTNTSAAFSSPGAYVLRLEANDGALTASDDVAITITAVTNLAPQVNAGPDQTVLSTATVTLPGKVTDDGLPKPPGKVKTGWTMVSGPGKVTFKDFTVANTLAKFSVPGKYVLRLTADDGELQTSDDVIITVGQAQAIAAVLGVRQSSKSDAVDTLLAGRDLAELLFNV
ncbi:MAG: hypothetical protein HY000_14280 [Planctomycetes bacterium]|nr:hypothetical protein [Planctomycetota bacterium]